MKRIRKTAAILLAIVMSCLISLTSCSFIEDFISGFKKTETYDKPIFIHYKGEPALIKSEYDKKGRLISDYIFGLEKGFETFDYEYDKDGKIIKIAYDSVLGDKDTTKENYLLGLNYGDYTVKKLTLAEDEISYGVDCRVQYYSNGRVETIFAFGHTFKFDEKGRRTEFSSYESENTFVFTYEEGSMIPETCIYNIEKYKNTSKYKNSTCILKILRYNGR